MDKYKLEFKLPYLPKLPNQLMMSHWRMKQKEIKMAHTLVYSCTLKKKPILPLKRAKLSFIRVSSRQPDQDNLVFSFKHVQDGLIKAKILVDDNPHVVIEAHYSWRKGPQKTGHCLITIEEL